MVVESINRIPAAILIQKHVRGYLARKERDQFLIDKVYKMALKGILEKPMFRHKEGKTPVYFPEEYPQIILKQAGDNCDHRFRQMVRAKRLCQQMGYTHLVIPKARVVKDWMVEERLLLNTHPFEQAKAYLDNREACAQAIVEFSHFVFERGLTDMKRDCSMFKGLGFPRVDNFPLFQALPGRWAIGLIDIEHDKETSAPIKAGED